MIYRSYSLERRNDRIRRALIMVHGTNRNADHYFATAMAAAFLAGAVDDTVVIAPHIIACNDKPRGRTRCYGAAAATAGARAARPQAIRSSRRSISPTRSCGSSRTRRVFPNMKAIVVAGHSAGGQFVTRYEMANSVHDTLGVPVTYVVANPSSYAWPDARRGRSRRTMRMPADAKDRMEGEKVHTKFTYGCVRRDGKCPNYNRWPLGLENRTAATRRR